MKPNLPSSPCAAHLGLRPIVLAALGCALLSGCGRSVPATPAQSASAPAPAAKAASTLASAGPSRPSTPHEIVTAALQVWPRAVRVQGSLIADEEAIVGTKVAGRVHELKIDLGTHVAAGQVLVTLDTEDFDLRVKHAEALLAQARAKLGLKADDPDSKANPINAPIVVQERALLEEAKANVERGRSVAVRNALSAEELLRREAILRVAEARYNSALNSVDEQLAVLVSRRVELAVTKQAQTDAVIEAPFDAMVSQLHVAPGNYPNIGQPVATLVRVDPLRYRAGVPESVALKIDENQTVRIFLAGQEQPLVAKISRVSPTIDPASRTLVIEADVPNPGGKLPVGLFAEADIILDPQDRALAVPARAITEFAGIEKVRVLRGDQPIEQTVHTGRRRGDWIEILGGLAEGDQVMTRVERGQASGKVPTTGDTPTPEKPAELDPAKAAIGA